MDNTQFKSGLLKDIPKLIDGELYLALDVFSMYIGTNGHNICIDILEDPQFITMEDFVKSCKPTPENVAKYLTENRKFVREKAQEWYNNYLKKGSK